MDQTVHPLGIATKSSCSMPASSWLKRPEAHRKRCQRPCDSVPNMPANQVFPPEDRPEVQLLRHGQWVDADLHAWQARDDEQWALIVWTEGGQTWCDTVPADEVRPAEFTDHHRAILRFFNRSFPDDESRDAALREELQISPGRYQLQLNWIRQQVDAEPPP